MPNELNIALKPGLTVTAQRYQNGAAVGSAISLTEVGTSGFYTGNMTGTAGTYQLTFRSAGANVGSGSIVWDGTNEVASTAPTAAQNASAVRTELSTELGRIDANISSRLAPSGTLATVTNLTNAPASVTPADIWSHASRTITGGTVDTLTNAPTVPSPSAIASQVRTELGTELGRLDASVSSRLASASYTAPSTPPTAAEITTAVWAAADKTGYSLTSAERSAIAAAVEGSLLNEADGQAVLNAIVGAIGNQNLSEVSLVAAIRSDIERTGGKLDSIPTTAAPTAAQNATAVWSAATRSVTGGTVDTLTNAPASVTPSDIWSHSSRTLTSASGPTAVEIRQEIDANSTKLDAAISSRLAASEATKLDAVKVKTDALPIERLQNCATTAIVGNLIAQANS